MAGEQVEGLPEALREWVEASADERGRSTEEVIARAVAVYRLLDDEGGALPDPDALATDGDVDPAAPGGSAALRSEVSDLEARVAALDADLDEKIDDVRSRVVQVKRETDAKAEADHDHPELREAAGATESTDGLEAAVESLRADLGGLERGIADLDREVGSLETTVDEGFANYEEVLEYLTEEADDHGGKLSTLATVLAEVRTRVARAEAAERRRGAAEELQEEANRLGVGTAACGSCGERVRIGLLSGPECPHCASTFEAVEPPSGLRFLSSATLAVGERPALEGETVEATEPADVLAPDDGDAGRTGGR